MTDLIERLNKLKAEIKATANRNKHSDREHITECLTGDARRVELLLIDIANGDINMHGQALPIPVVSGCCLDSDEIETALSALSHAIKKTYQRQQFDRLKQLQRKLYKAQAEL